MSNRCTRARTTNDPTSRMNSRTARGRRTKDLYRAFVARLTDPEEVLAQAAALAAAELTVSAEGLRARLLGGEAVDPDQVVRIENLAQRAERKLAKFAGPKKTKSLSEHLAELRYA